MHGGRLVECIVAWTRRVTSSSNPFLLSASSTIEGLSIPKWIQSFDFLQTLWNIYVVCILTTFFVYNLDRTRQWRNDWPKRRLWKRKWRDRQPISIRSRESRKRRRIFKSHKQRGVMPCVKNWEEDVRTKRERLRVMTWVAHDDGQQSNHHLLKLTTGG